MEKKILVPLAIVVILGIGIIGYSLIKKDSSLPQSSQQVQTTSESDNAGISPLDGWKDYASATLGISFRYPEKILSKDSECADKMGYVPVRLLEEKDDNALYMTFGCGGTLDSLKEEMAESGRSEKGWRIRAEKVTDEKDLSAYVKANLGEGCLVFDKEESTLYPGAFNIIVRGEDWDREGINLGNTTCKWEAMPKLMYFPASQKLLSIERGEKSTFCDSDTESATELECFDETILESLRVN